MVKIKESICLPEMKSHTEPNDNQLCAACQASMLYLCIAIADTKHVSDSY